MRVLVAEDSAMGRRMLERAVRMLGYECLSAEDGAQAWDLFQVVGADVIVSDWVMPGLAGPELCRRVRAHRAPYTYFIMLTMLEDRQHALEGMEAGADDYLVKPLDPEELRIRLVAAARVTALHRELANRRTALEAALARRESLLRVAKRFSAEGDAEQVLSEVLAEAVALLRADDGGVARWEPSGGTLRQVRSYLPSVENGVPVPLDTSASGLAVQQREAVILNNYQERIGDKSPAGRAGAQAVVAVPLLHEGRLLGSISVSTFQTNRSFSEDDVKSLELLASTAAASLVGLERARLEGVLLAARTAQHELNNKLALATGYAEFLALDPSLSPDARESAQEVLAASHAAAAIVDQLRRVTSVQETDWGRGVGSTINLAASVL